MSHLSAIQPSLLLGLLLAASTVGCSDDGDDEHSDDHGTETGDGDGDGDSLAIELKFGASVGELPAACGESYTGVGSEATTVEILDFRFYVHGIELIDADGNGIPLALTQDGLWQHQDLALLDFEDGSAGCQDAGTSELNDTVFGSVPAGDYVGVRFVLGIPFELNHVDVDAAPSPLNVPSMFWNWQGGFKYARIDLANDNPDDSAWFWHQGATGCESAGPNEPPDDCLRSNRVTVEFASFDASSQRIVLDLATLLDGVDVGQNTPQTAPGCMMETTDPECIALFSNLGLDLDSGECTSGCAAQTGFRVD